MQTIYLDISNKGVIPTIYAKQGDVGRKFEVVFTNSGLPYVIADESFLSVWYNGESGEGNYTEIDGHSAFTVNVNKVAIEIITQALVNEGNGVFCLVLNEPSGRQIGSWNIPYICEAIPGFGSEESKAYYTAFSDSIEKLYQTTENLTPEVIGAAPAGYGYGESQTLFNYESLNELLSALDATLSIMPERSSKQIAISCNGLVQTYFTFTCTLWKAFDGYATLEGITYDGARIQLLKFDGAWGAVEWKNPPMRPGVEYRTTERWNGKPVYTMLINCGTMPTAGGTSKIDMPSTINGRIDRVLSANGTDSDGNTIPYSWLGEYITEVSASRSAIYIYAKDDYSANTADVQIRYTRH